MASLDPNDSSVDPLADLLRVANDVETLSNELYSCRFQDLPFEKQQELTLMCLERSVQKRPGAMSSDLALPTRRTNCITGRGCGFANRHQELTKGSPSH
jgi:hypothetical protein